jgi:cob(I)alamin adenosyltransferase
VEAYGDIDELNSILGVVRAGDSDFEASLIESIQRDLFSIGGQLATPVPEKVEEALAKAELHDDRISELEQHIDRLGDPLEPLRAFVLPGGTGTAATLHHARCVARRAERRIVTLAENDPVPPIILTYVNRLSDLLFTLARRANHDAGVEDATW